MKILHVIVDLDAGGAERMLQRLVQSDSTNPSCRHCVVSLTDIGAIGMALQRSGVRVDALGLRSVLDVPRVFWKLLRLVREIQPDIVQTWMYHADFLGGLAARLAGGTPVIWGVRTTDVPSGRFSATMLLRWACARLSHRVPDLIVCAAEASRRSHAAVGYCANKLVVVPNGYDFSQFTVSNQARRAWRSQFRIGEGEFVVGSLGRLHADKDQENFVRMAALLGPRYPQMRFLMVGRGMDGGDAQLGRWIAASGVAPRFILCGEREDVPQCLAAMDVFCLHSRNEGFPNVLAEAMAMGLPCVTTDVGDAAMLIGDVSLVVPKECATDLAKAVAKLLLLTPEARSTIGALAKSRVESEFSIAMMRARFDAVYRQVLAKAKR